MALSMSKRGLNTERQPGTLTKGQEHKVISRSNSASVTLQEGFAAKWNIKQHVSSISIPFMSLCLEAGQQGLHLLLVNSAMHRICRQTQS